MDQWAAWRRIALAVHFRRLRILPRCAPFFHSTATTQPSQMRLAPFLTRPHAPMPLRSQCPLCLPSHLAGGSRHARPGRVRAPTPAARRQGEPSTQRHPPRRPSAALSIPPPRLPPPHPTHLLLRSGCCLLYSLTLAPTPSSSSGSLTPSSTTCAADAAEVPRGSRSIQHTPRLASPAPIHPMSMCVHGYAFLSRLSLCPLSTADC